MDPLDTMTAADWRRVYERSQEYVKHLLRQGVAMRRREAELVDRLRRREERVRELEEENQRLRDRIASRIVEEEQQVQQEITKEPLNSWLAGLLFGLQRGRDIVTSRARDIAKEDTTT